MSNSSLVSYTRLSPNHSGKRTHKIDTITIHCMAGQMTVEGCGATFASPSNPASSNYGVGRDGRIGLYVDEGNRSWCSSNGPNDQRAITIEVASDDREPYAVNPEAYAAMLDLVEDCCRRNGIKKLVWSTDKADRVNHRNGCNMTVHRDYAAKSCPGTYLYERMGSIAEEINRRLGAAGSSEGEKPVAFVPYTVRVKIKDLRIRKGPGTGYAAAGFIAPAVYTIVEEADGPGATRWGKLKSGAGWISLDYVKKM